MCCVQKKTRTKIERNKDRNVLRKEIYLLKEEKDALKSVSVKYFLHTKKLKLF